MMKRGRGRRKDNNGVRLDVMDQDPRTESVSNRDDFFESTTQSRKLSLKNSKRKSRNKKKQVTDLCYHELPEEIFNSTTLDLQTWSLVIQDSCLKRLADFIEFKQTEKGSNQDISMIFKGSILSESLVDLARRKNFHEKNIEDFQLKRLDINGAENISDKGIRHVLQKAPKMEEINLGKIPKITDECIQYLSQKCPNLTSVNLSYNQNLNGIGVACIGDNCKNLKSIVLSGCQNIPEWALHRLFSGSLKLEELDISNCEMITDLHIKILADSCPCLKVLNLKYCRQISDSALLSLSHGCLNLTHLDLTRKDLQYKITDIGILALSERCAVLQHLILSGCDKISDVGIRWLADGCPAIIYLDLTGCASITDLSMRAMAEGFCSIKKLLVPGCNKISDAGLRLLSIGCPELEDLNLSFVTLVSDGSLIGEFGAEGIPALTKRCRNLHNLNLAGCVRVGDLAVQALGEGCESLMTLNFACCSKITSLALCRLIKHCKHLTHLNLKSCHHVNDDVLQYCGLYCSNLEFLNVHKCFRVTNKGLQGVARCRQLTNLNISGCSEINDIGLLSLTEQVFVPGLKYLGLANLPQITQTGLAWIAQKCHTLLKIDLTNCNVHSSSIHALQYTWKYATFRKTSEYFGLYPKYRAADQLFIDEYGACWKAAITIQNLYRTRVARRELSQRKKEALIKWAVTRIQSIFRGRQGRKLALIKKLQQDTDKDAAIRIQSWFRRLKAKLSHQIRLEVEYKRNLEKMAVRIQCAWRCRKARMLTLEEKVRKLTHEIMLNNDARNIQRIWRGYRERKNLALARAALIAKEKESSAAATRIQNIYRGRTARKEADIQRRNKRIKAEKREKSAMKIQSFYRGFKTRERLIKEREEHLKEIKAVTMLQRRWRLRKGMLSFQLIKMTRKVKAEQMAALKIQSAWRRKNGYLASFLLKQARGEGYEKRMEAAAYLQHVWRQRKQRLMHGSSRLSAFEKLLLDHRRRYISATKIQARYRGIKGRQIYQEKLHRKKKQWKALFNNDEQTKFYYNQDTGEIRYRMPQEMLDIQPQLSCSNCGKEKSVVECQDCVETYCQKCWDGVHAGGRRKAHVFRCLYDYYGKRIEYGDGEFPSKWPTEIEQDENVGWFTRMKPHREPDCVIEDWERYVDDVTNRKWYFNRRTKEETYKEPSVFEAKDNPWTKYYDEGSGSDFYYNSVTCESTYNRPAGYKSPRQPDGGDWMKYHDESTGYDFYHNLGTGKSTYERPLQFLTPRQDQEPIENGIGGWKKYFDDASQAYFYFNQNTGASTFHRPPNFLTPRNDFNGPWQKLFDNQTGLDFYYNSETYESTYSPPPGWVDYDSHY